MPENRVESRQAKFQGRVAGNQKKYWGGFAANYPGINQRWKDREVLLLRTKVNEALNETGRWWRVSMKKCRTGFWLYQALKTV